MWKHSFEVKHSFFCFRIGHAYVWSKIAKNATTFDTGISQIPTLETRTDILRPNMSCIYFVGTNSLNKALFEGLLLHYI